MIPKSFDAEILREKDLEVGDELIIQDELIDNHPILSKSFLGCLVTLKGIEKLFSLNKTSYNKIKEVYGQDTEQWIGKTIVYKGKEPTGKSGTMMGKIFEAAE